jgi:hypothetical protein
MDAHFTAVLPASVTLPKEDRVNARAAKEVAERALCDLANRRGNYPPADAPGYAWKRAVSKAATVADLCSLTESNLMAAGYPSTQERTRRAVLFIKESLAAKGLSLCGDEP